MWKKILGTILLFYLFALLQNSFFTHFSLFGAVPNLVFVFFFLLVFFIKHGSYSDQNYIIIFLSVTAGIFLDISSFSFLGLSVIMLAVIGFALKKIQSLLKNREDSRPFIYFLPLFIICFLLYDLSFGFYLQIFYADKVVAGFDAKIIFSVVYNSIIASALFYIYKWQKFIK